MYVLVGLFASGHRGPAQTAQAEDVPGGGRWSSAAPW